MVRIYRYQGENLLSQRTGVLSYPLYLFASPGLPASVSECGMKCLSIGSLCVSQRGASATGANVITALNTGSPKVSQAQVVQALDALGPSSGCYILLVFNPGSSTQGILQLLMMLKRHFILEGLSRLLQGHTGSMGIQEPHP